MVAFEYGEGLLSGGVGAGVGFGQAERADFTPGEQVGEVLLLLRLGAVLENRRAAQGRMRGDNDRRRAAHLREFLDAHGVREHVAARAAVLLREVDTHHAEFRHFLDGLHREALLFVDFLGERLYLGFRKRPVHLAEHLLFVCQMKVHIVLLLK